MHDTLGNGGCTSCLLEGGYNLTAMTDLYCESMGIYDPVTANSISESMKDSSTSQSSPAASSTSSDLGNDDSGSISLLPSVTFVISALLILTMTLTY